jgi:signal transduction histidine kinase
MRASSPTTLLLGVVLLCVATALAGVWMALSPAWLGAGFEAKPDGAIVITRLTADGPLARVGAKVGDRLAGVGANTAAPALRSDEIGGLDTPATEASVREKERREDAFAKALSAKPLTLRLAGPPDGQGSAVQRVVTLDDRSRPLSALNPEFWANLSFGLIATLIVGWVWALRPRELSTQLFALTGLSMLAFTFGWAVNSSIELVMARGLASLSMTLNMVGAVAFGGAMIGFFLAYPKRVAGRWPAILMTPLWLLIWAMTPLLPGNPSLEGTGQAITSIEMALIIVAIAIQAFVSRKDPAAMAATRWLGLSVIVGAGAFIANVAVPIALGMQPFLDPRYSLGFFVIIYVGMAVGLRRHKLFELDQWAFRILFYISAGAALLALDGLLITALGTAPQTALGISLLIVAFAYLPFRDVLWRRTIGRKTMKEHEMFAAVAQVALIHDVEARAAAWKALLSKVYEPLEIATGSPTQAKAEILEEGVSLGLPAAAGTTAIVLRFPFRGRGLFGAAQAQLADQLVGLLSQIEEGRDAYARGVVEERLRIARDLHDDVGARLLSGLHRQDLSQTREAMRGAIGDLRSIVSGLSGHDLPLEAVLADLRHETAERLEAAGIALDWTPVELTDPDRTAPYRVYKNLTSAVREVVSNAIRHAGATRIVVTVHEVAGRLELTISDDGVGLPREPGGRRSGLANLERRLGDIGGAVEIPDTTKGTVVRLSAPLEVSAAA